MGKASGVNNEITYRQTSVSASRGLSFSRHGNQKGKLELKMASNSGGAGAKSSTFK